MSMEFLIQQMKSRVTFASSVFFQNDIRFEMMI